MHEYGCRGEPLAGLDAALDQMAGRVRLWNRFVEIERHVRQGVKALLFDEAEERQILELTTRIAALRHEIVQTRRTRRQNSARIRELSELVVRARGALAALMVTVKANRRRRFEESRPALKILEEERARQAKEAQKQSGLYWCNYDDVRHAYEVARVRVRRQGLELREHQWNGSGQVSVRFQRGLPVSTVFTRRSRRLQIDPVSEEAWNSPIRSVRRKLARTKLRLRVASTEPDHLPVWIEIGIVVHRPLPTDGTIRSAALLRKRLGLCWQYRLILTVACPNPPRLRSAERPSVGVDLGWRITSEGLRVAFWADSADCQGTVVIPSGDVSELNKIGPLWSVLDRRFSEARSALFEWRLANEVPDELLPYLTGVAEDQSPQALLEFVNACRTIPAAIDPRMLAQLAEWKQKHTHLWTWAVNLRDQLTRRRMELFRRFAAGLVQKYGIIFVEQFDLRWLSRKAPAEIARPSFGGKYRVAAAPGILRRVIENACRRTGVAFFRVPSKNTTRACYACGRIEEWDSAKHLFHTCACGATWDQDYNAALQILRAGLAEVKIATGQAGGTAVEA
jgi:Putative transposase DNA-binding domain